MPLKTLPPPSNIKCYIWLINDNPAPSFLEKGNQRTLPHFPITKSTNLPVSLASSTDELSLQCPYCSAYILISFISPQLVASEMSTITEYHCFSLLTTSVLAHKPLHSQLLHTPTPPFLWHAPPTLIFLSYSSVSPVPLFKRSITLTHVWGWGRERQHTRQNVCGGQREPTGVSSLLPHEGPRDQLRFSDLKASNSTYWAATVAALFVSL